MVGQGKVIRRTRKISRGSSCTESLDSKNGSERCMNKTVLLFRAFSPTKIILRSDIYFFMVQQMFYKLLCNFALEKSKFNIYVI